MLQFAFCLQACSYTLHACVVNRCFCVCWCGLQVGVVSLLYFSLPICTGKNTYQGICVMNRCVYASRRVLVCFEWVHMCLIRAKHMCCGCETVCGSSGSLTGVTLSTCFFFIFYFSPWCHHCFSSFTSSSPSSYSSSSSPPLPAHCCCLGLKPPKKRLDYNPDISARQRIEVISHSRVFK